MPLLYNQTVVICIHYFVSHVHITIQLVILPNVTPAKVTLQPQNASHSPSNLELLGIQLVNVRALSLPIENQLRH